MRKIHLLFLLAGSLLFSSCSKHKSQSEFEVQEGFFQASLTETGELQAVYAKALSMPTIGFRYGWRFKIIDLVENGAIVQKGDVVAKIDQSSVRKVIIDLQTQYDLEQANLNKLIIQQGTELASLETRLQEEKANYDLKKLELEKFKFESPQKHKIKELEFEQVQINLKKATEDIKRKKIIQRNQISIQEIKVEQIRENILRANKALQKLIIKSPIDGIVQIRKNRRTKQNYRIGDELFLGQSFAIVPDVKHMKVKTVINELDYKKTKVGQSVKVRLDALPDVSFEGEISYLGKLSKPKEKDSKVKVFDAEIVIKTIDERLKPGMTVSCQIFYADFKKAQFIRNDCLLMDKGKVYVYTKEKGKIKKLEVKAGASNNKYTLVLKGLNTGQKLIPINKLDELGIAKASAKDA